MILFMDNRQFYTTDVHSVVYVKDWKKTQNEYYYITVYTSTLKEKENWRILTNKEIYAMVKTPTITETIWLNRLCWLGHVQRMEGNRVSKRYYIWIWKQQGWMVDQETDGKMKWGRMEE